MLEPIIGSLIREQVLLFLHARGEGYAREIARFFDAPLDPVQKQLKKLHAGGVLQNSRKGRTLLYSFDPDYRFTAELRYLFGRLLEEYPREIRDSIPGCKKPGSGSSTGGKRYRTRRRF